MSFAFAKGLRNENQGFGKDEGIGLNPALEDAGIEIVETDLGEHIIQLAGEKPSHIIAPAIHKTRQQVGRLFEDKLGIPYTEDPPTLTLAARKALRAKFLKADMGISGCHLACAETGHITTVSNEGNMRMTTTLPRVHVAFMGMERILADLQGHQVLFRLLALGAAAQNMADYVSYIGGPGRKGKTEGPLWIPGSAFPIHSPGVTGSLISNPDRTTPCDSSTCRPGPGQ
jgi:L-lactate dehydrogenase complex protein LldF